MTEILIIADDLTGAMDTGVQFSKRGVPVCVASNISALRDTDCLNRYRVAVLNTASRHINPNAAYQLVYEAAVFAKRSGIAYIYKKTDSTLRGNVGSELQALLDASGQTMLPFLPAYPNMKRIVKNGMLLIDGIPVSESVFSHDPIDPVTSSSVAEILHKHTNVKVLMGGSFDNTADKAIWVFDAESNQQMEEAAHRLGTERLKISAGCAGFAEILADTLMLSGDNVCEEMPREPFLILNGSINPISAAQIEKAEKSGISRYRISPCDQLIHNWSGAEQQRFIDQVIETLAREKICIVDNGGNSVAVTAQAACLLNLREEDITREIASGSGELMQQLLLRGIKATIMCIGGDTLQAIVDTLQIRLICPVSETEPGVVLTRICCVGKEYYLLTKSGGFGDDGLIVRLKDAFV